MPLAIYRDGRGEWHFRPRIDEAAPSLLILIPIHASFNGRRLYVAGASIVDLPPVGAYYAAFLGIFGFRLHRPTPPIEPPCRRRRLPRGSRRVRR